jgi:nucleoside-diphosphate-sugar epimerase
MPHDIFITGGTGYIGRPLISTLAARGHAVRALVRPGSARRLPPGTPLVEGNVLDASGWAGQVAPSDTLVHLFGTPHPSPAKAAEFARVDLPSIRAAVEAAAAGGVRHLIYVSVAHPAPIMQAYINVRMEGERLVRASRIPATLVRPFYVLGPGHWWPYALVPFYALARALPATHDTAVRLGLVSIDDMIAALVHAVEHPPAAVRVMNVPDIRAARTE